VLAPIYLVKNFIKGLTYVIIFILTCVIIALGTIPLQLTPLSIFAILLTIGLISAAVYFSTKGVQTASDGLVEQMDLLEGMASGDVRAAMKVSQLLAGGAASTAGNVADTVINIDPADAIGGAADAAGAAGDAAGEAAAAGYGAVTGAFGAGMNAAMNPMDAASGAADMASKGVTAVADTAAAGVAAAMELNPLFAFEKIMKQVFDLITMFIIIASPAICIIGIILWKLGVYVSGVQMFLLGIFLGALGSMSVYLVKKKAGNQLADAGTLIIQMQIDNLKSFAQLD